MIQIGTNCSTALQPAVRVPAVRVGYINQYKNQTDFEIELVNNW